MLSKLALRNVKRQVGNYLIYFITVSFTVSMLFAVSNIIFNEDLTARFASNIEFKTGLMAAVVMICIIVSFVLSYATSFMLKLRKREFGTYLTLGMTRKNILTIFISETILICMGALAIGLVLGLFTYQGLMAIMMKLMEMEFSIALYSVKGLILTICLVIGVFVLASVASAYYLKRVTIYELIHGDRKVEKSIKHPKLWFAVTVVSFVLLFGSMWLFDREIESVMVKGSSALGTMILLIVFAAAVVFFHIGLARSMVYVLLNRKKLRSKSTNTFVLRQLSGTLGSNSIMLGFLAFLLTFTVIGANISFIQKASQEALLNSDYPHDIRYTQNIDSESEGESSSNAIPEEEAEKIISKYVDIKSKFSYSVYTSNDNVFYSCTRFSGEGYEDYTDNFMKLSDFNSLIQPLGFEKVELHDEYMVIANMPEMESVKWDSVVYESNGKSYKFNSVQSKYPMFNYVYFYVVVPDEAAEGMAVQTNYTVYDTGRAHYDAMSLKKELTYSEYHGPEYGYSSRCDYTLREYGRQSQNSSNAVLVIGALFVATIFLFMAMAILALKTLSSLSDDKQRYNILSRLGASEREQSKALFRQTFSFFALPFAVPLFMSIPVSLICQHIIGMANMDSLVQQIPIIAAVTAAVMAVVYILYYIATYLIAKKAVIKRKY